MTVGESHNMGNCIYKVLNSKFCLSDNKLLTTWTNTLLIVEPILIALFCSNNSGDVIVRQQNAQKFENEGTLENLIKVIESRDAHG